MEGAAWRAGRIEEYQSQHVPIRSKMRALGLEGAVTDAAMLTLPELTNTALSAGMKMDRHAKEASITSDLALSHIV